MSSDPNKKSARTFQCRDVLWDTFEQMARELECSVDYLINESMKQYARQRSYGGGGPSRTPFPASRPDMGAPPSIPGYGRDPRDGRDQMGPSSAGPPPSQGRGGGPLPPPPARSATASSMRTGSLPVPPPTGRGGLGMPAPPPRAPGLSMPPPMSTRSSMPPQQRSVPPPIPRSGPPPMSMPANGYAPSQSAGALSVLYQGERHPVTKDRFVIGRGKQSSDLTLKDPNVSRQHAMIEFQNGVYFMVDMGSTNGVEYNGQRIARKQIAEGDVFRICDHDLLFTYR